MTEEELENKAEEYAKNYPKRLDSYSDNDIISMLTNAYREGAKSRDSEIEEERKYAFEYLKPLIDGQKKEIEELKAQLEERTTFYNKQGLELIAKIEKLSKMLEMAITDYIGQIQFWRTNPTDPSVSELREIERKRYCEELEKGVEKVK